MYDKDNKSFLKPCLVDFSVLCIVSHLTNFYENKAYLKTIYGLPIGPKLSQIKMLP